MGAHIHFSDIRAPVLSDDDHNLTSVFLLTPAVSPKFKNNPGYSVLDLEDRVDSHISNFYWRFFELGEYIEDNDDIRFHTIEPMKEFSIDINDYKTIRNFNQRLATDEQFLANFLAIKNGFNKQIVNISRLFLQTKDSNLNSEFEQGFLCARKYLTQAAYDSCMDDWW